MNKFISILIVGLFSFGLNSCISEKKDKPVITVTILPLKYFADQIVGNKMDVMCMVPAGSNPESYDPSPNQLVTLSKSKSYLAVGELGFELAWLSKLQQNQPALKIYKTSKGIPLIEHKHNDSHRNDDDGGHFGLDPHTWSSPKTARVIAQNILSAIIETDPKNEKLYRKNFVRLINEIDQTDSVLSKKLRTVKNRSFLIYHPALTYLARDYGLNQYSVEFNGKEPTPQHLKMLVDAAKKHDIRVIFIQKEFDSKNAQILAQESGCKIVVIDPLSYQWSKGLTDVAIALASE
ncbi:metal ABC transporter solute-binding protein, Zn/Mn family [Parabacteroides sp. FAFU027]|uniref:metal ABC transporter solute-binding protein, Zn/Mn family n=1 Tax=Parabacteroides sp. FAFU027 TaxID=2922715 RepID=UPI001FAEDF3B|nr:zinc ABC transporter substrate-binding protein [Parabacteroides sp. FAFU027]